MRPAIPVNKANAFVPPPPPPPAIDDIKDLYFDQKLNITNVKQAVPSVLVPSDLRRVPDPARMAIEQEEKREKIKNVRNAVPALARGDEGVVLVPPVAPDTDIIRLLYEERRSKISNVRPAVPLYSSTVSHIYMPPPPSREDISTFFE